MSKFNKLVELAKYRIEETIIDDAVYTEMVRLHKCVEDAILSLGNKWYYELLLSAGYREISARQRAVDMDYYKLANKLDDWYTQELYPKLVNTFQSQGKTIYDY